MACCKAPCKRSGDRFDNALNTARAAAADGVVAGGGVALARAAFAIENGAVVTGEPERRAFARALKESFRRIAGAAPGASRRLPSKG